ncbi:hypothetical protein [Shimia thalassica]|uniref:hypothetical protein n=1 Tax=Shimia thalassica TaxID=1715693 RepID=UPI0027341202|nr:hypothetical protein [Shimia thalassica]MDP2520924.1 hypothetical protein [Shimia thalassica]
MMISTAKGFGFICLPKCASTSIEAAIRPYCNIRVTGHPGIKHLTYQETHDTFFPLLEKKKLSRPHMFAVVRNPLDWVGSWYKYRSRDALKGSAAFAGECSFQEFVEAACSEKAPAFARIQNQSRFLVNNDGKVSLDSLIRYSSLATDLPKFLVRFGVVLDDLPIRNVSPDKVLADMALNESGLAMLRKHFATDYKIFESIGDF